MSRLFWAIGALAMTTNAAAAPNKSASPMELVSGQTIVGKARAGDPVDTYYLVGISGTAATFEV